MEKQNRIPSPVIVTPPFDLNVVVQFFRSSSLWSKREMPAITGTRTAAHMKNERASSKGLEMPLTDTQIAIKM